MSLYNGPARGGNRGGKDQFNWESVKSDKDREFYLGHSVKATTGRWQKGVVTSVQQQSSCSSRLPICSLPGCTANTHRIAWHSTATQLRLSAAGKDVFWYTREKQEEEAAKARLEMQAIKQREEDLMNEVGEQPL